MHVPEMTTHAIRKVIWCGCIFLLGCKQTELGAPLQFEDAYTNQQVRLAIPPDFQGLRRGDDFGLTLTIHSDSKIVFPANFGVRMFSRTSRGWQEIAELPTERYPVGEIVFDPQSNQGPDIVVVIPDIPADGETKWLRVYVIGRIEEAGGTKQVAAYIDVGLTP